MPIEQFDAWADSLYEEIANVNRSVWDVFARWRLINALLAEGVLALQSETDGTILLSETEVFSSVSASGAEEKTSDENSNEMASQAV